MHFNQCWLCQLLFVRSCVRFPILCLMMALAFVLDDLVSQGTATPPKPPLELAVFLAFPGNTLLPRTARSTTHTNAMNATRHQSYLVASPHLCSSDHICSITCSRIPTEPRKAKQTISETFHTLFLDAYTLAA